MNHPLFRLLRVVLVSAVLAQVLTACGIAKRWGDVDNQFSPDSKTAMVIGGVDSIGIDHYMLWFHQYDRATQRLLPEGGRFVVYKASWHDELSAYEVPAGYYAMVMTSQSRTGLGQGQKHVTVGRDQYSSFSGYVDTDADVSKAKTYRVKLAPGEAVYLGEYVSGPYAPEWVRRDQDLEKILSRMPNLKVTPVFRAPTPTTRLEQ